MSWFSHLSDIRFVTVRGWTAGLTLLLVSASLWAGTPLPLPDTTPARARELAFSGKDHRAEALNLLQGWLQQQPGDVESRVLYGTVLSWDGRYDEARQQLSTVLKNRPDHGDALPALINVELWSDHPAHAERLAREALVRHPERTSLMLLQARALHNMNRNRDAVLVLNKLISLEPANEPAREMRRNLQFLTRTWELTVDHSYDWFGDGRDGQHETSASLRGVTRFGSLIGRLNRADRFGLTSYQEEMDFYPHFRSGTYGYINVGYSADNNLYPSYRVGADLYQTIGHGFEVSGGFRRLQFSDDINIATMALARYYRSWLFTARAFLTPDSVLGLSHTVVWSARRFLGGEGIHDFIEVRYSHGASPAQATTTLNIENLASNKFAVDFDKTLGRWGADVQWSISTEDQLQRNSLNHYSAAGTVYYRF